MRLLPHALELWVVSAFQPGLGRLEVRIPGHEPLVVMRPQVHEQAFDRLADLGDAGQHAVGENVFGDPWVAISVWIRFGQCRRNDGILTNNQQKKQFGAGALARRGFISRRAA